jgi:hypothetical protein
MMASLAKVRFVHVCEDGTERDYLAEPEGVPTLKVKVERVDARFVEESTETFFNNGEAAPPPGRGWVQGLKTKTGHRWFRRRWLCEPGLFGHRGLR